MSNRSQPKRRARHSRRLFEVLENRRLLATFAPLPSNNDGSSGSLRAAIIASNRNGQDDTINLSSGVYQLFTANNGPQENAAARGDLDITEAGRKLTIQGRGAATIIDANEYDRIFQLLPNVQLVLKDLVLRDGVAVDDGVAHQNSDNNVSQRGGGILTGANSTLTLINVLLENCIAGNGIATLPAQGGGIYAQGAATITNSTLLNNKAMAGPGRASSVSLAEGGAIAAFGSTPLTIIGSGIIGNTATGGDDGGAGGGLARGGGIASFVNVNLSGSFVDDNVAVPGHNTTQPNGAEGTGGGLFAAGHATLSQTSFSGNVVDGGLSTLGSGVLRGGSAYGGAIHAQGITGTQLIVQDNRAIGFLVFHKLPPAPGVSGGDGGAAGGGGIYVTGNSTFNGLRLERNVAHGGPGMFGSSDPESGGTGGNGGAGGRADGGGLLSVGPSTLTITNLICSENQAIGGAGGNGGDGANDAGGTGGTAGAGGIAVGGGINANILSIRNGHIANNQAQAGSSGKAGFGLSTRGGIAGRTAFGGGIYVNGSATITHSDISRNSANGGTGGEGGNSDSFRVGGDGGTGGNAYGGGVYVIANTFELRNSTVSTNTAAAGKGGSGGAAADGGDGGEGGQSQGGGLFIASGATLNVRNSTIALNNAATGLGGDGAAGTDLPGSPGAQRPGKGGGVYNDGTARAFSTIFGDNTASGGGADFSGPIAVASNNLLERAGTSGLVNGINGNIVGQDAKLGALGRHGGPTFTHLLLAGSPAVNRGSNTLGLTTDQRGLARSVGAGVDIGAVEMRAPVVSLSGTIGYTENAPAIVLASGGAVSAPDRANLIGGKLIVRITTNANGNDRLAIKHQGTGPGQIGVSGTSVTFGGNVIGTFSGGSGANALVINFTTGTATPAAVQALVRAITFRTLTSNPSTAPRKVTFVLNDGSLVSDPAKATKTVTVRAL